ncbi:hypothetical protein MN086_10605 [Sulfurovum sp. XGS-02]|uniref:hypothetical protein n=1 Tax=Sulfurovum sp. XGS-02 TaxID=2925411 RepID=UPI0020517EB6|nr:hypothetical protein [Sulfurovum sp. XGS-02]UPT77484.1 hypothetical protein MN086_10605 [Sulfurovum sp. XGS-02]
MKNLLILAITGAVLLSGCQLQPKFDPNDRHVLYAKGKAYALPFGVNYNAHIPKQTYAEIRNAGIPCSDNGIIWHKKGFMDKVRRVSINRKEVLGFMKNGYARKILGCSEPLTKIEHDKLLSIQPKTVTHKPPR